MADVKQWITVHPNGADSKGQPIPVMEGESKGQAVKNFVSKHKKDVKELNKKSTDELKQIASQKAEEKPQSLDPLFNIPEKYIKEADEYIKEKGWNKGYMKDAMFNRWISDLNYFYGYGGRSADVLWAKDLNKHLALMKTIHPTRYNEEVKKFRSLASMGDFKKK